MGKFAQTFRDLDVYQSSLQPAYEKYDERYERVLSQIVLMVKNADKWCTLQ